MSDQYTHQIIKTNGIQLHVVTAGKPENTPILLLHGFPEFWYGWHHQIDFLAENGYYVIVPDQRGYNLSDKPSGVKNYHIDLLAKDITGLIDAMGYEQIYVAAHDWGGVVAWWIATHYPQYLKKLMILNAPHPNNLTDLREFSLSQMRKSWYILFFQLPVLPERMMRQPETASRILVGNNAEAFTDADIKKYQQAWSQPDAITGMLNWYRAIFRYQVGKQLPPDQSIHVPIRIVWGEQDTALGKPLAERALRLCANGSIRYVPEATHWIAHDTPDIVNQEICEFFIK